MKIIKFLMIVLVCLHMAPISVEGSQCPAALPSWDNYWCGAPKEYWGSYYDKGLKYYPPPDYVGATCPYVNSGYTCTKHVNPPQGGFAVCSSGYQPVHSYRCTKNNFSATQSGDFTLIGKNLPQTVTTYSVQVFWEKPSPFIYLYNAPDGEVNITLDSALDTYAPLPAFNQQNGWTVDVTDSKLSLNGEQVNHLFYELALNKITLNRNGRNFASKEELIDYLKNSDFLEKLSFSEEEKANSLGYLVPKIEETTDSHYYYLTILETESIEESSSLRITPEPDTIDRKYFAVYPTAVPVRTTGDFEFPPIKSIEGFTVKETGEFLINSSMFVTFK